MLRSSVLWSLALCVLSCHVPAWAAGDAPVTNGNGGAYVADPEVENLIEKAGDKDAAVAKAAVDKLVSLGSAAERQLLHHLQTETGSGRVKYAELLAKCGKSKVGYRVTLELQPDGSGNLTLWSDRTLLAECGRRFDRLMGQPERTYTEEDLRQNQYSKVELINFMDEGMKHLEARVDAPSGKSIETIGLLSFKTFESLTNFAKGFDTGGFYMLNGASFFDTEAGVRSYRFRKGKDSNRDLYQKNLLLFYNVRWEFVLDLKGKVRNSNAMKTEGTKLVWNFDICQMLRGEAQVEARIDSAGLVARPAPSDDTAVPLPAQVQGDQPVAIPAKKLIHARACKKTGSWQELVEHNQLVELDARNSIGRGPLQFHWSQTSGPDLALTPDALTKDRIGMRIPEAGVYRFELTVSANGVSSKPVEVEVQVEEDPSEKPVATGTEVGNTPLTGTTEPAKTTETKPPETHKTDIASANPPPTPPVKTTDAMPPKTTTTDPAPAPAKGPEKTEPVKVDPAKADDLHKQGVKLMKAGNYKDAKQTLTDALAANPQDLKTAYDLGVALFELREFAPAVLKFEEAANAGDAGAMMYVGHCNARGGAMDEAREWYRRGTGTNKQVSWEIMWNYGSAVLGTKDYSSALSSLQTAESQANSAKVSDYRIHRDLAIALHGTQQDAEAMKHLTALQELGYTPDATLLAEVTKATGAPAKKPDEVVKTDPPKTEDVKTDPPKTEPAKTDTAKVDPPKTPDPAPAKVDPPKTETKPDPKKVAKTDPPKTDPAKATGPAPLPPPRDPPKKKDPRPPHPKRPLPPIPKDFEGALAAGKRAFQDALGHAALKTEDDKIKAAQSFEEAEAMYRGAWAVKPGDEALISAFRELSEYVGAIALVKNTTVQSKVRGLVILDGSASIGPKDKPLYCVWEQTGGEDLALRAEQMADKQVSFKIRSPGVYKFDLAVSDGVRGGNPVTVTVEVEE